METTTSKNVFLKSLTREEQLGTLFEWCQSNTSRQAKDIREHDGIKKEINLLKGEIQGIGRRNNINPSLTTSQKIDVLITKKNAGWIWYRDKVLAPTLSAVHTIIILYILYSAFGGKIP